MAWLTCLILFFIQIGEKYLDYYGSPSELLEIVHNLNNRIGNISSDVCDITHPSEIKLLLITDSLEYLYNLSDPGGNFKIDTSFKKGGYLIFTRPTITYKGMMASYPVVKGLPCIVIGTPQNTGLTMDQWVLTILHEHFHLLQMNLPGYFEGVDALNLSGGDESGMWMLNYDFPYNEPEISRSLKKLGNLIADCIKEKGDCATEVSEVLIDLKHQLSPKDFSYMEFQLWQEGIARFIEYEYACYLSESEFKVHGAQSNFTELATGKYKAGINYLRNINSEENKREVFYDLGWGIRMILKNQDNSWQENYWRNRFKILN